MRGGAPGRPRGRSRGAAAEARRAVERDALGPAVDLKHERIALSLLVADRVGQNPLDALGVMRRPVDDLLPRKLYFGEIRIRVRHALELAIVELHQEGFGRVAGSRRHDRSSAALTIERE